MTLCAYSIPSLRSCSDSKTPSISFIIISVSQTQTQTTASDPDKFPNQPITIINSTTTYKRHARPYEMYMRATTAYHLLSHSSFPSRVYKLTFHISYPVCHSTLQQLVLSIPKIEIVQGVIIMLERKQADIALTETQKNREFVIQETIGSLNCHHC